MSFRFKFLTVFFFSNYKLLEDRMNEHNLPWDYMINIIGNIVDLKNNGLQQETKYGIYTSGSPLLIDLDNDIYIKGTSHNIAFDFIEKKIKVIQYYFHPNATYSHCEVDIIFPLNNYLDLDKNS